MSELITLLIILASMEVGFWLGRHYEGYKQSEKRLQFSNSQDFIVMTWEQKIGALVMWKWLREQS